MRKEERDLIDQEFEEIRAEGNRMVAVRDQNKSFWDKLTDEYFHSVLVLGIVSSLVFGLMVKAYAVARREAMAAARIAREAQEYYRSKGQVAGEMDKTGGAVRTKVQGQDGVVRYDEMVR